MIKQVIELARSRYGELNARYAIDFEPSDNGYDLMLMILPQVHLRKPCYDFSFL